MARRALLSIVALHVDCPHCREALWESATVHENIPWGKTVDCWNCKKLVQLPTDPFAKGGEKGR